MCSYFLYGRAFVGVVERTGPNSCMSRVLFRVMRNWIYVEPIRSNLSKGSELL